MRRCSCASSQTLPIDNSSRIPGVAIANAWNRRLEPSAWPTGPVFTRRYSSIADSGSIEIVNRPSASSTSSNGAASCANV